MNDAVLNVRLPRELADALATRARRERYSLSDEVRRALWRHAESPLNGIEPPDSGPVAENSAEQEPRHVRV